MGNEGILRLVTFTLAAHCTLYFAIGPLVEAEYGKRVERSDLTGNLFFLRVGGLGKEMFGFVSGMMYESWVWLGEVA